MTSDSFPFGRRGCAAATKWNSSALVKPLVKARKAAHSLSPEEFSLLHAADFRYRLDTEVLPALWRGQSVVADRYLFTALARDATRGLDLHWLLELYRPLFWPAMVFYFSISPETSGKRVAAGQGLPVCDRGCRAVDLRPAPADSRSLRRRSPAALAGMESGSAGGVAEPSP